MRPLRMQERRTPVQECHHSLADCISCCIYRILSICPESYLTPKELRTHKVAPLQQNALKQDALPPGLLYRATLARPMTSRRDWLYTTHLSGCEPPLESLGKPTRGPRPKRTVIANVPRPCEIRKDGGRSISLGCVGERRGRAIGASDRSRNNQERTESRVGRASAWVRAETRRDHRLRTNCDEVSVGG